MTNTEKYLSQFTGIKLERIKNVLEKAHTYEKYGRLTNAAYIERIVTDCPDAAVEVKHFTGKDGKPQKKATYCLYLNDTEERVFMEITKIESDFFEFLKGESTMKETTTTNTAVQAEEFAGTLFTEETAEITAVQPTEALEEVQAESNTPEIKKPSEKRTAPKTKEVKNLTPEELAQKLEELKHCDDWRTSAVLMLRGNRNPEIIMIAGISAGVITFEEFDEYMTAGRMPHYHTYAEWQKLGRQVKTGEHARFKARIWKYTERKGEMTAEQAEALNTMMLNADGRPYQEGDETLSSSFIKKEAFFFGLDQTEKAGEIKHFEIGRQYTTSIGVITVTDRTETTLTFTAKGKTFTKDIQANKKTELVKLNKAGLTAQAIQEVPEAQKPIEKEVKQESAEPETVKFIPDMVYWGKYQILKRTEKTLVIKNILTGTQTRKTPKIMGNYEYIKFGEYETLRAIAEPETYTEAVRKKFDFYMQTAPEYAKKAEQRPFDGFARQRADEAEKALKTYARLLDELTEQAA